MHNYIKTFIAIISVSIIVAGCASDEEKKISHFHKGQAYFEEGQYKSAVLELKNALQIDPRYIDAQMQLAQTYMKLGDAGETFRAYSRVAELDPNNADAQLKIATFLLLARRTDDAKDRVTEVLAKAPENVEALLLMAAIQDTDNNRAEAVALFEKAITLDRNNARAYMGLARVYQRRAGLGQGRKNP